MKLTLLFLTTVFCATAAEGVSQSVTFSAKNASLQQVIATVEQQAGYVFLYEKQLLKDARPINLSVKNMPVKDFLARAFQGQDFTWSVENQTVVLQRPGTVPPRPTPKQVEQWLQMQSPPEVNGTILDPQGKPLQGAAIQVKGTTHSATSGANGSFVIAAAAGQTLVISYIGFATQEVLITRSNAASLEITLAGTAGALGDIVINTGFQTLRKEKMTGAAVSVSSTELEKRYTPTILDNLEGRVPGLVTYRGITTIRGVGTINASKKVLIVLDGLPIEGSISDINPYDVENITVLKDAAAAAIYGARAANGVIVITTKKAKGRRTVVEFASDITVTQKPDLDFKLLTPAQQVTLESDVYDYVFANSGGLYPNTAAAVTATETSITNGTSITQLQYAYYQRAKGVITQAEFDNRVASLKQNNFRQQFKDKALLNNLLQQYNLAIRTDGEKFQSSLVANYKNDNTGIINAYNRQLNLFYKGTYKAASWIDLNYGINSVLGYSKGSNSSFATSPNNVSPYQQLFDTNGKNVYYTTAEYNSYNTTPGTQPAASLLVNHLDELGRDMKKTTQQNTRYYVNLNARVLPGLTLSPQFQYENLKLSSDAYSKRDSYIMHYLKSVYTTLLPDGGKLAIVNTTGNYWTARGQAQYQRNFGKHAIDVIAGTEFRQVRSKGTKGLLLGYDEQLQSQATTNVNFQALKAYKTTTGFKPGFNTETLYNTYLANAIGLIPDTLHRFNSNYANATYTYDNRFNVFGSYRVDYADIFGLDEKFRGKPLWSAGFGWNLHNERFMTPFTQVNFLKFRAAYGVTGNIAQNTNSFLTGNTALPNPTTGLPVLVINTAANPELRWEKTGTLNLGVDFALFNNRLSGSFDWYRKKSTDLLVTQRVDPSEGFTDLTINNGGVLNNGLELGLQYEWLRPKTREGLGWSSAVVVSSNKNKVTYLDEVSTTPLALAQGGYKVGFPVNSLFSYQYKGLDNLGRPQWLKADGTLSTIALTSSDLAAMVYSGSTDPRLNITLNNEFHYKGFSLTLLAVYYGGQYLRAQVPDAGSGVNYGPMPSYLVDSWKPGKTNTQVPGFGRYAPGVYPGTQGPPAYHLTYSDAFVRAGDFIKLRTAILGYQLPEKLLAKSGLKAVRLRFQLNNPKALWTKNDIGIDPETGGARVSTSYVFGISVNY